MTENTQTASHSYILTLTWEFLGELKRLEDILTEWAIARQQREHA